MYKPLEYQDITTVNGVKYWISNNKIVKIPSTGEPVKVVKIDNVYYAEWFVHRLFTAYALENGYLAR